MAQSGGVRGGMCWQDLGASREAAVWSGVRDIAVPPCGVSQWGGGVGVSGDPIVGFLEALCLIMLSLSFLLQISMSV